MKKTFASLVAALLAATLLAFSAPAATAADPYTGTVATKAVAVAPTRVLVGKPVVVKFKVIDASTRTPKGKVVLKAFNKNGKLVKRVSYAYDPDRRKYSVGELSKGMRQKLSVARAVLHEPELLFLDAPTAGLDPEAAEDLIAYLSQMIRAESTTVVICTHQLHGLEHLCTDVGILESGRLVLAGDVHELLAHRWPRSRYTLTVDGDRDAAESLVGGLVGQVDGHDGQLEFSVDHPAAVASVIEALVAARFPIRAVIPHVPTLHDLYFASLTGRDGT